MPAAVYGGYVALHCVTSFRGADLSVYHLVVPQQPHRGVL